MYIASQVIVVLGLIIDLTGKALKNKKHILLFMAIASILFTLSYVLLQSPLPMIANFIAMVRSFWYLFLDEKKKKYTWYIASIVAINAIFVVCAVLLWRNALDLVLIASTLILSVGLSFKSANITRITVMANSALWMSYNLSLSAYMNFACDIIGFLLALGALIYYTERSKRENKFKNFDTFIFDFDGTLINSEPYHKLAHSKVLSLILGKDILLSDKDFERYIGKRDDEIFEMYKKDFAASYDSKEMINKKVEMARDLLLDENVKIYDYFFKLLKQKGDRKFFIVSNQHKDVLYPVLKAKGIENCFDKIFCLSEMDIKKDYFYKNLQKYIKNAQKIAIFEDDVKVLSFLRELGYDVFAVENEMNFQNIKNGKFKNVIKV